MQKDNLGAIYERLLSRNNGTGYSFRSNLTSEEKGTTFRIGEESPKTDGGKNGRKSANMAAVKKENANICNIDFPVLCTFTLFNADFCTFLQSL